MKVVHLSCYDTDGGAARAAWRVHDALRSSGAKSSMFVALRNSHDSQVEQYVPKKSPVAGMTRTVRRYLLGRELTRASRTRPAGFEDFRDDRTVFGSDVGLRAPDADVYHIHQITDFVDYGASLSRLAARAPIVWTLHEMTPFTGGCHYAYDCERFTRQCGSCPQLGSVNPNDLSRAVWKRKDRLYGKIPAHRVQIVCPSRWMAAEAGRSSLFGRFPMSVIPYGLDTDVFRPMPQARRMLEALGLASSARTVLFVADTNNKRRKGFDLLTAALRVMPSVTNGALISVGRGEARKLDSALPHVHLGTLTEDRMIAAAYSMADLFVIPSLEDNLPNTVLEAMACGTPVVGFRVGGIPDMVRPGENGLLVEPGDVAGLSGALETLLRDDERRSSMGKAARMIVEREYTLELQAERYMRVYRSLVGDSVPARAQEISVTAR